MLSLRNPSQETDKERTSLVLKKTSSTLMKSTCCKALNIASFSFNLKSRREARAEKKARKMKQK
jgi:hypothetical protein